MVGNKPLVAPSRQRQPSGASAEKSPRMRSVYFFPFSPVSSPFYPFIRAPADQSGRAGKSGTLIPSNPFSDMEGIRTLCKTQNAGTGLFAEACPL